MRGGGTDFMDQCLIGISPSSSTKSALSNSTQKQVRASRRVLEHCCAKQSLAMTSTTKQSSIFARTFSPRETRSSMDETHPMVTRERPIQCYLLQRHCNDRYQTLTRQ